MTTDKQELRPFPPLKELIEFIKAHPHKGTGLKKFYKTYELPEEKKESLRRLWDMVKEADKGADLQLQVPAVQQRI